MLTLMADTVTDLKTEIGTIIMERMNALELPFENLQIESSSLIDT